MPCSKQWFTIPLIIILCNLYSEEQKNIVRQHSIYNTVKYARYHNVQLAYPAFSWELYPQSSASGTHTSREAEFRAQSWECNDFIRAERSKHRLEQFKGFFTTWKFGKGVTFRATRLTDDGAGREEIQGFWIKVELSRSGYWVNPTEQTTHQELPGDEKLPVFCPCPSFKRDR